MCKHPKELPGVGSVPGCSGCFGCTPTKDIYTHTWAQKKGVSWAGWVLRKG